MKLSEQTINRENTRAAKYDFREKLFGSDDILPMWVADMDLPAPKALQDAIIKRAEHNIYGYTNHDDHLLKIIQSWLKRRHDYEVDSSQITFTPGVIPALHALVQSFTEVGDKIVIQPPVYPPFFSVVKNHNRELVESPLQLQNGQYKMNFEDLEQQFKNGAKAFILCSPHNPVSRVWTEEELQQLADLCVKYNVYLFSDEIHADIVFNGYKHTPIAKLNEQISAITFTLMAPSKTFNVAGLQGSFVISPNNELKKQLEKQLSQQGFGLLNTFAYVAMEATFQHGDAWLEELIPLLEENYKYLESELNNRTKIKPIKPEGTYLIWLDFTQTGYSHKEIKSKLNEEAKVGLNDGVTFGKDVGDQFMRINIAAPTETVKEATKRLVEAFGE
ncbi:MalY/PatB family protein [Alkalibacillus haloalkaliphilus]|uniref:cysteine-S-conjugate beta-lyase n=1 Tax=Alkalibacillus haloalkaliphilus TaxID=94136 RepID=A0A511W7D1_9BACI|nr:PatB family C-S lyase [Alkalibacillus haloalkaliphilus]GEN46995.1 aminotransferase [Alkalibacillus haloalkaliphilus]